MVILGTGTEINDRRMIYINPFIKEHNENSKTKKSIASFFVTDDTKAFIDTYKSLYFALYDQRLKDENLWAATPRKGTYLDPILFLKAYTWIFKDYDKEDPELLDIAAENSYYSKDMDVVYEDIYHNTGIEFEPLMFFRESINLKSFEGTPDFENAARLNTILINRSIDVNSRYLILKSYFNK